MGTLLKNNVKSALREQREDIIKSIRDVEIRLKNAYSRFDNEQDNDLIESVIYEIRALKASYAYLIKKAKISGVKSSDISSIWVIEPDE